MSNDRRVRELLTLIDQQGEIYVRAIAAARAQERIHAAAPILVAIGDVLQGILDLEPDLAPEITTAVQDVQRLAETLDRMQAFVSARIDVEVEKGLRRLQG